MTRRDGWIHWTDDGDVIRVTFREAPDVGIVGVEVGPEALVELLRQTIATLAPPDGRWPVSPEDTLQTVAGLIDSPRIGHDGVRDILRAAGAVIECDEEGNEL